MADAPTPRQEVQIWEEFLSVLLADVGARKVPHVIANALTTEAGIARRGDPREPHPSLDFLKRQILAEVKRKPGSTFTALCREKQTGRLRVRACVELIEAGTLAVIRGPGGMGLVARD